MASSISSGSSCAMNTRSKPASASAAASAEWKRVTSARARARLASRGPSPAGGSDPSSSEYHCPISSSGMRSVLPYISPGGSVTPMWLPNDFDIFCTPSIPVSSGSVSTICGACP